MKLEKRIEWVTNTYSFIEGDLSELVKTIFREDVVSNVAISIKEWLSTQDNPNELFLMSSKGKFTYNNLVKEIEQQTKVGIGIETDIIKLTIDLLHRGKQELSVPYDKIKVGDDEYTEKELKDALEKAWMYDNLNK